MLRAAEPSPVAVSITGGDLVSAVQVLLQSERLKIARALPEESTLTGELLDDKAGLRQAQLAP